VKLVVEMAWRSAVYLVIYLVAQLVAVKVEEMVEMRVALTDFLKVVLMVKQTGVGLAEKLGVDLAVK